MPSRRLSERVALVADAGSALGVQVARGLAAEGAKLVLAGGDGAALEDLAVSLVAQGAEAVVAETDLRQEIQVVQLVGRALDAFGAVDLGVVVLDPIERILLASATTEDWRRAVEVRAVAPAVLLREILAVMPEGRGGDLALVLRERRDGGALGVGLDAFASTLTDGLRGELRARGVRLIRVRTAEDLDPADAADAVLFAVTRPRRLTIAELSLRPTLDG